MMTKELFIDSINAIKSQMDSNAEIASHLSKAFPNAHKGNFLPSNKILTDAIINIWNNVLSLERDGIFENTMLEWWVFESDFYRNELKIYGNDDQELDLSDAEKLYSYLTSK